MKKLKSQSPEAVIHQAFVDAGHLSKKTFKAEGAKAHPSKAEIAATLRANPFQTKFEHLSAKSLGTLDLLRAKVSAGGSFPAPARKAPSLPIDPRANAVADGLLVIPSQDFGPEFECLIEFSTKARKFVLFHKVDSHGNLPQTTRLAIARHLGLYARAENALKSGAVRDTTRLDAGADEREKAGEVAAGILVPAELLAKDLEILARKYGVHSTVIRYQAQFGASATPPADLNPRKPGAITPTSK